VNAAADLGPRRAPLPDWLAAAVVFVAWLVLRNLTYPHIAVSFGVDVSVVVVAVLVVLGFERGDPPRLGWALALLTFALASTGITMRDQVWAAPLSAYWMHVYFAVNVCWTATIAVFARNVLGVGLQPSWSLVGRVVVGTCIVIALGVGVLVFTDAWTAWAEAARSTAPEALGPMLMNGSSGIANPLVFIGAVLITYTMLPMTGGAVARPYLLLSASAGFYLALDVVNIVEPEFWKVTGQIVFSFGEAFFIAAAFSQIQLNRRNRG
jgi:hypothetical protein